MSLIAAGISAGANLLNSAVGAHFDKQAQKREHSFQKHFAKRSLGWRIKDARAHGISPLAAMGGAAQPSGVGISSRDPGIGAAGDAFASAIQRKKAARQQREAQEYQRERDAAELSLRERELDIAEKNANTRRIAELNRTMVMSGALHRPGHRGIGPAGYSDVIRQGPNVLRSGASTDAHAVENRYGSLVGDMHGVSKYVEDLSRRASVPKSRLDKRGHLGARTRSCLF